MNRLPKNVTYYLGAGASFNSLPMVLELKENLDLAGRFLQHHSRPGLDIIADELKWLSNEHAQYYSVDTAAKIHYHKMEVDALDKLKRALSIYLIIEQSSSLKSRFSDYKTKIKRQKNIKPEQIDSRYFRLLAYLFGKRTEPILPSNLNVISWNYDRQLELAFQHFTTDNLSTASNKLGAFPRKPLKQKQSYREKESLKESNLIHLNGIGGLVQNEETIDLFDVLGNAESDPLDEIHGLWIALQKSPSSIQFAWESQDKRNLLLERAIEVMDNTELLVIVGYSFPNFNREIDDTLIQKYGRNSKLVSTYIQNPQPGLDEAFKSVFDFHNHQQVEQIHMTDEFFIPPGI